MAQPNPTNTFLNEAEDLLNQIEEIALELNPAAPDPETINRLFRAFHTIKGSGSMFGFEAVAAFTHHIETTLDQVREGRLRVTEELLNLILNGRDRIKQLLEAGQGPAPAAGYAQDSLVLALGKLGGVAAPSSQEFASSVPESPDLVPETARLESYRIFFRPDRQLLLCGTNPVSLLNELRELGPCQIRAGIEAVPLLGEIQPDQCYWSWEIQLQTDRGLNAIKDVFIFVEEGSELKIEPQAGSPVPLAPLEAKSPAPGPDNAVSPGAVPAGVIPRRAAPGNSIVRVPSDKLDRLVNLVGELVMTQSRLTQVTARVDNSELCAPVEEMERLVSELRENVLGIRMMPIGTTFSRFKRLVHDLSAELGKEVELVTEGAETELDKTVLDQLGDPLVHLIRNSLDHGIELPAARESAGKSRLGRIRLTAAHTGSDVLVTIQDDGRGIDPAAVRAKALEKKLISPELPLTDREILNLIFLPGFSTAREVTSISGRGVGMDVVKRQVDALRGSVVISSEVGRGTTMTLTLPLTLAIIDGLLVEIGTDKFIIPMSVVTENVELHRWERASNNGRNVVTVRSELVPYIRLRELFGREEAGPDIEKIVIVRHGDERVGLVVDRVLGSHQTVIQSLGRFYRNIGIISGSTVMGDGRVALILDLAGVVNHDRSISAGPAPANLTHN